jgi:hypothetical protein
MVDEPDDELTAFATRLFALARAGETDQLAACLGAGVDPNLANQKGDTLVMLAAAPRATTRARARERQRDRPASASLNVALGRIAAATRSGSGR